MMRLCPAHLPLGLALLIASPTIAQPSHDPAPPNSVRARMLEKLKADAGPFRPAPLVPVQTSPILAVATAAPPPPSDAVLLDAYLVQDSRGPSLNSINAGMKKAAALKSDALFHKDYKKIRTEYLLPPGGGSKGGLELPVFRLSW